MFYSDARVQHLANCRELTREYFANNGMFVSYIRQRRPNLLVRVPTDEATEIKRLLKIFPNMTEKSYLVYLEDQGRLNRKATPKGQTLRQVQYFRTINSIVKANNSPIVGIVVCFKSPLDGIRIGWSLCKEGDFFNIYDGIRRAIERNDSIDNINKRINFQKSIQRLYSEEEQKGLIEKEWEEKIPHTCFRTILNMIARSEKAFKVTA